jgi:tight adherence protein B
MSAIWLGLGLIALVLIVLGAIFMVRPSRDAGPAKQDADPLNQTPDSPAARPFADFLAGAQAISRASRRSGRSLRPRRSSLDFRHDFSRADLPLHPREFVLLWALVGVAIPAIYLIAAALEPGLRSPILLLLAVAAGFIAPVRWLRGRADRRLNTFNKQLPDAIYLIANSLRAGNSFLQALDLVGRELPGTPVGFEFAQVFRQVSLGLSLDAAMENLVLRMPSADLDLVAKAVSIQHAVGGDLSEVLDRISTTLRERVRIKGEIRVLTAQQRLSGYVIAFMPVVLFVVLSIISPNYIGILFRNPPGLLGIPVGVFIIAFAVAMITFGLFVIRRIVEIEM